jgi:hypothetical protein
MFHLCTGASLYAPYSLLLISKSSGWGWGGGGRLGVGGGEAKGPSWRGRIKGVEGLLYRTGGVGGGGGAVR